MPASEGWTKDGKTGWHVGGVLPDSLSALLLVPPSEGGLTGRYRSILAQQVSNNGTVV